MKLWGFGKLSKDKSDDSFPKTIEPELPSVSGGVISESDYESLWMLLCVTFSQILPRTDLYLCLNERGVLALLALPDLMVSMTLGKSSKHPRRGAVLIQQIQQGKDKSYLSPITYTDKQFSGLSGISSIFNRGELRQWLKKYNWQKIMPEVKANNFAYLNDASYRQEVNRIKVLENASPRDPDDFQTLPGYDSKIPIFLYTEPHSQIEINRERLHREIFLRKYLSDNRIEELKKNVTTLRPAGNLRDNETMAYVISRVEAALLLSSSVARPPFADIMLDPEMTEFDDSLSKLIFTPKGIQASEEKMKSWEEKSGFSIVNWQEPDIAHIALHVTQFNGQPLKESVTSPAITIFRDEMGIHALKSWLFRINAMSFSLGIQTSEPVLLDKIPTPQIPEINWKPFSEEVTLEWWQTDAIAKKILWLATYNLASHLIGKPEELVCSVTPIGNNVIQIAMLFDNLEAGAPYAFAIERDDLAIQAIPVFQAGTYEFASDGALIARKSVFLKNYTITRKGERIQSWEQVVQFIKPIYSTVINGEYKEPKVYETGGQSN